MNKQKAMFLSDFLFVAPREWSLEATMCSTSDAQARVKLRLVASGLSRQVVSVLAPSWRIATTLRICAEILIMIKGSESCTLSCCRIIQVASNSMTAPATAKQITSTPRLSLRGTESHAVDALWLERMRSSHSAIVALCQSLKLRALLESYSEQLPITSL